MTALRVYFPLDPFSFYPCKEQGRGGAGSHLVGLTTTLYYLGETLIKRPNINDSSYCLLSLMILQPDIFFSNTTG